MEAYRATFSCYIVSTSDNLNVIDIDAHANYLHTVTNVCACATAGTAPELTKHSTQKFPILIYWLFASCVARMTWKSILSYTLPF